MPAFATVVAAGRARHTATDVQALGHLIAEAQADRRLTIIAAGGSADPLLTLGELRDTRDGDSLGDATRRIAVGTLFGGMSLLVGVRIRGIQHLRAGTTHHRLHLAQVDRIGRLRTGRNAGDLAAADIHRVVTISGAARTQRNRIGTRSVSVGTERHVASAGSSRTSAHRERTLTSCTGSLLTRNGASQATRGTDGAHAGLAVDQRIDLHGVLGDLLGVGLDVLRVLHGLRRQVGNGRGEAADRIGQVGNRTALLGHRGLQVVHRRTQVRDRVVDVGQRIVDLGEPLVDRVGQIGDRLIHLVDLRTLLVDHRGQIVDRGVHAVDGAVELTQVHRVGVPSTSRHVHDLALEANGANAHHLTEATVRGGVAQNHRTGAGRGVERTDSNRSLARRLRLVADGSAVAVGRVVGGARRIHVTGIGIGTERRVTDTLGLRAVADGRAELTSDVVLALGGVAATDGDAAIVAGGLRLGTDGDILRTGGGAVLANSDRSPALGLRIRARSRRVGTQSLRIGQHRVGVEILDASADVDLAQAVSQVGNVGRVLTHLLVGRVELRTVDRIGTAGGQAASADVRDLLCRTAAVIGVVCVQAQVPLQGILLERRDVARVGSDLLTQVGDRRRIGRDVHGVGGHVLVGLVQLGAIHGVGAGRAQVARGHVGQHDRRGTHAAQRNLVVTGTVVHDGVGQRAVDRGHVTFDLGNTMVQVRHVAVGGRQVIVDLRQPVVDRRNLVAQLIHRLVRLVKLAAVDSIRRTGGQQASSHASGLLATVVQPVATEADAAGRDGGGRQVRVGSEGQARTALGDQDVRTAVDIHGRTTGNRGGGTAVDPQLPGVGAATTAGTAVVVRIAGSERGRRGGQDSEHGGGQGEDLVAVVDLGVHE